MAFDAARLHSLVDGAPVKRSTSYVPTKARGGFISASGLILLLLVGVVACIAVGQLTVALVLAVASVLLLVLVGNGLIVRWLVTALQAPEFFRKPKDFGGTVAIVLLGDGNVLEPGTNRLVPGWLAYSRIECAAQLYLTVTSAGSISKIVVTGDGSGATGDRRTSVYAERLQALGVPAVHINVEGHGRNTYRQAELTGVILGTQPYDHLFLVTSGLHMRRALRYFEHFGLRPTPVASDLVAVSFTPIPLGQNFAIADIALHQFVGLLRLRVYNALGLNKPSESRRHSAAGTNN